MTNDTPILTPVGRLVAGSLYQPQTKDMDGNPLVFKSGNMEGEPRTNYYFAIAIRKGTEQHWSQIQPVIGANGKYNGTDWASIIWSVAHAGFPNNPPGQNKKFAWKIVDGDSTEHNQNNKRPCDKEGYPGHWVINFSSSFAPGIVNADGSKQIVEANFVNPGDFIQVSGTVSPNGKTTTPGIFLNHRFVAFAAYGERIQFSGIDPQEVGFGGTPLPPGASVVPLTQGFNPAPTTPAVPTSGLAYTSVPAVTPVPVVPHPGILMPPPPALPAKRMTAKAGANTYDQMIAGGWTDATLIQHGYMEP